uniref:Ras homolog family member D n=1 Tax=Aquila chrysaetos chrysaetos TaxID=223781 RepID=A0A663FD58_AQUCH
CTPEDGSAQEGAAGAQGGAAPSPPPETEVKAVVVGDGGCGKTSLLVAFARGDFPKVYVPTVFEKYTASLQVGGKPVKIHLWDTAGQEDYDRLRPLSYSDANVVLICFDVTDPNSYENILTKWYPEVNHFCKGVPVLLVGCKTDLRQDRAVLRKLQERRLEHITYHPLLLFGWGTRMHVYRCVCCMCMCVLHVYGVGGVLHVYRGVCMCAACI